ncbi:MAG: bifunctional phosphoglucose/phosphomannose isomerase [Patescibacteria group bacterium]
MRNIILNFPKQFEIGLQAAENIKLAGPFANIIVCGMGGSALPGSLLPELGVKFDLPLFVHRDYGLPKIANEKSLIICISFSGNTEETLSAYQEAIDKKYQVIGLCTGGKLKDLAEQNNLPAAIVPNDCLQPRFGTGYLVAAVLKILSNCEIINNQDNNLLEIAQALQPERLEQQGKNLAEKLINKIPIIYASNQYKALARIWKIKFNENSKVMAFWNYFPELNHNEMVGLMQMKNEKLKMKNDNEKSKNFHFIILRDSQDNPKILKRMDITADLIKEAVAGVDFVEIASKSKLEKVFNCLLLGDWASYYLALAYGQNPVPVEIVEKFKKQL